MTESIGEEIQREMAEAFDGAIRRTMSDEARDALRRFIDHAVVAGVDGDAVLYGRYRAYLKCRLEQVARKINEFVNDGGTVTWDDIRAIGEDEVGNARPECSRLIVPDPASNPEGVAPEARICLRFNSESMVREPAPV